MDLKSEGVNHIENKVFDTTNEANNLLKNGILVETSSGLVCMSLDALSSDLNLSVEEIQNVATQLILQQGSNKQTIFNFDSDGGFSSEWSDISTTTSSSTKSALVPKQSVLPGSQPNAINNNNAILIKSETNTVDTISVNNQSTDIVFNKANKTGSTNENVVQNICGNLIDQTKPKKGRGGWPKGRKRKPELLNLPPKAPATGYNLYLNEQRKNFKDAMLPFYEITKIIGNKWSSLSLEEKKPYLNKAEEDKKRYREELKQYRQSDAYRAYLAKKRKKRLQNQVMSESDMDATDDFDEEDNEELYCRTCDQWFYNFHNKREHLQGRMHLQSVAGDMKRELYSEKNNMKLITLSTAFDESSMDGVQTNVNKSTDSSAIVSKSVSDAMATLLATVAQREKEIDLLKQIQSDVQIKQESLYKELRELTDIYNELNKKLVKMSELEKMLDSRIQNLWQLPSWFIITDFGNIDSGSDFTSTE